MWYRGRMKTCSKCGHDKPLDQYYVHSTTNKPYPRCKPCQYLYKKLKKDCWFRFDRLNEKRDVELSDDLWSHHRMTVEMFNQMLDDQGGVCFLCQGGPDAGRSRLCIDHDHSCCPPAKSCFKCRRKLLCNQCNRAIGLLNDNPDALIRAAEYLLGYKDILRVGDS